MKNKHFRKKESLMYQTLQITSVLLVMIFFVVGCNRNGGPDPAEPKSIVYGATIKPNGLVPCKKERLNAPATYLSELIFDGLVNRVGIKQNGSQDFRWALADSWTEKSTENRRLVIVRLFPGVFWHDGNEFTANDVIFSWKVLQASNAPIKGWITSFIEDMSILDVKTILVKLKVERSEEVVMELLSSFKIFPESVKLQGGGEQRLPENFNSEAASDFLWKPVGTGPFKVKNFTGTSAELVKNDGYFLGAPKIDSFLFRRIEDYNILMKRMEDKDIDIAMNIRPESCDRLEKKGFRKKVTFPYSFHAIVYNFNRPPFNELRFRRSVNMVTDKVALARKMFPIEDVADFINSSIFPHNYQFVKDSRSREYSTRTRLDPEKAKELLSKSKDREFTLLISSQMYGTKLLAMANKYKDMMSEIGLKVNISDQTTSQYESMLRQRNYDAVYVYFSGFDHFYDIRTLFADRGKLNLLNFNNSDLRHNLKRFGNTISYEDLTHITRAIHKEVEEFAPACFLFTLPTYTYYNNRIMSVVIHPEVGFAKADKWTY